MQRSILLLAAIGLMVGVSAVAWQKPAGLPILDWAARGAGQAPPVAVLLELGLKDANVRDWSGQAQVSGAKLIGREGYCFRRTDKLLEPNGWQVSSHRALRAPKGKPGLTKIAPISTVGIVFHLADVQKDGALTIEAKDAPKATVALQEVLAGKSVPLWNGTAVVRLVTTATPVAAGQTEDDFPAAAQGPDGTLYVAHVSYTVKEEQRRIESPPLAKQPANFQKYYTPEFGDQVFLKSYRAGQWSQEIAVTGPNEDIVRCAVAASSQGDVWVIYSAQRRGGYDLFARKLSGGTLGPEQQLTTNPDPDLTPVACTDAKGQVWVACQSWDQQGQAHISVLRHLKGKWEQVQKLSGQRANCWYPAIAAGPNGEVAVAYDCYHDGDYDVLAAIITADGCRTVPIATTTKFEARPSVAYDAAGRLWVAYEEGPVKWGKDYGALDSGSGNPLFNERSVRVVCLDKDGSLRRPAADLPTSRYDPPILPFEADKTARYERASRFSHPRLGLDGAGRIWLAHRQNFGTRISTHPGNYSLTFVRRLEENTWSEPIEVHHSCGLLDHRPVLLPHAGGGLTVIHNTDGRYTTPEVINNQIYASTINLPTPSGREGKGPDLMAHSAGQRPDNKEAADERRAVQKMRDYRLKAGGKTYQLLRGEYHRHTEFSWDGAPDGSLEDMFRYAIDAARFDWIGNGDHDNGAGREYSWWLTQKFTDAYHVPKAFIPMFTYERSVSYPHGHRNCMFAKRGIRTLPRLAPPLDPSPEKGGKGGWPGGVHADDTKMLYRYLRELDGICAVHTSATGMGTDWRDNDPQVEPIVEIYQGDRMSYEYQGAPRAGYDPKTNQEPANVGGWFPLGFVNLPLQKGYKLSFQASSDHWSTHISYFIILAERPDRAGLLEAVKKRHCYGATDNILVDFRCGQAIMGDEVKVPGQPEFSIHVEGTAPLAKIDILRDSQVLATWKPKDQSYETTWTDPQPQPGTHYYYIRVLQTDNEIAWASPIWVTRE